MININNFFSDRILLNNTQNKELNNFEIKYYEYRIKSIATQVCRSVRDAY